MRSGRNIIFSVVIMFSFLWVIIGDLVAMHINVIYGVDVYSHQPYANAKKTNDKSLKLKKGEPSTTSFFVDLLFFSEEDSHYKFSNFTEINFVKELNFNFFSVIINSSGRSPPQFIL